VKVHFRDYNLKQMKLFFLSLLIKILRKVCYARISGMALLPDIYLRYASVLAALELYDSR
jgi:hypothetical protein